MRQKIACVLDGTGEYRGLSLAYHIFMVACIVASIVPLCFKGGIITFLWFDRIVVVIFIIDYILRWITADFRSKRPGRGSFVRYPVTFFAIVDLLAILPALVLLNPALRLTKLIRLGRMVRFLRWSRSIRAVKLLKYSRGIRIIAAVFKREYQALIVVAGLVVVYIFVSALILFQVEPTSFRHFGEALYLAAVTLTTVGYGDIYPQSAAGRLVTVLSSFVGIAIVALPTGLLTAGFINELRGEQEEEEENIE